MYGQIGAQHMRIHSLILVNNCDTKWTDAQYYLIDSALFGALVYFYTLEKEAENSKAMLNEKEIFNNIKGIENSNIFF